ncbi:MAG: dihydropteroate synthase [Opitutales bacterium]|nr:dihydropteroate synthase [Opitutales bacterium]
MPEYFLNGQRFNLKYPAVMGILNLTPDSFSDGGLFNDPTIAVEKANLMHKKGAQIIDLGAESTRPGSEPVSEQEELSRLMPILEKLPKDQFLISLDTTKPLVAESGLQAGAHIINDVSGGNYELLNLAEKYQAGFVLMHTKGSPMTMQISPTYQNVIEEVRAFFNSKKDDLIKRQLPRIWIDPGIGFGKTLEHNVEIMRNLSTFKEEEWGLFLGSSRKSWIDQLCNAPTPSDRLGGSIASALVSILHGVEIIRVHDVQETAQAISVAKELALFESMP